MRKFQVFFVATSLALALAEDYKSNLDIGPEHPDFIPNDGELESEVKPMKKPDGNYHIIQDKGVYVLNRDTFAHFVMDKDLVMVEFYAPWCGHCKSLEPIYAKAAKELAEDGLYLAKVDATKEPELAKEFMVQGFPTLVIFRKGEKTGVYQGPRTKDAIVEFMRKNNDPNWAPPPSATITLTYGNFTSFLKTQKLALVLFYAPWCKHCKQLMPEYEGAAAELKSWNIPLIKVDGAREKELADQYEIVGWPEIKIFRKGRVYNYKGPREQANIITFMKEQAQPPSEEKATKQGITNNFDRLDLTVVGFFNGTSDLYDEYIVAANEVRGTYKFMHTFSEDAAKEYGFPLDTVAVFQPEIFASPYENSTFSLSKKSATYKDILTFIKRNSVPLVGQRTKKNMFKYTERPLVVVFYDVNYDYQYIKDTQYVRNKVVEFAKHFVGSNLKFAISNEEEFEDEVKSLGFEDSGNAINVVAYSEKQKFKLDYEDDFTTGLLSGFIEDLRTGKVKPYMKSQPVPKKQEGIVKKVVAGNYDDEVHKVKKDAVVFFHAPWCGHCKEFDPIYKKLAKKMTETNENIVFAKFDATANDVPYMFPQLKGFPSIFFLSAYEKFDPIQYQGDRTYKAVREWINRHSSIFLTEEERTGQSLEGDEEIESFTSENFEEKMQGQSEEKVDEEKANKKEEL